MNRIKNMYTGDQPRSPILTVIDGGKPDNKPDRNNGARMERVGDWLDDEEEELSDE